MKSLLQLFHRGAAYLIRAINLEVEAPGRQDAEAQEYQAYFELPQRSRTGWIGIQNVKLLLSEPIVNYRVDPDPAMQTTFSVTTLNKAARTADNAANRQPDTVGIRKVTRCPVINLKGGTAYRALGFTMPGFDTLAQAKWAG